MRSLVFTLVTFVLLAACLALPTLKKSKTRIETDPELTAGYFEGDIVLDQATNRNGLKDEKYRWPGKVVHYHINSDIDTEHRNHILRGLHSLEDVSCIRFKEVPTDYPYYINVTSEAGGCYSYVGHLNRVQQLNFENYPVDTGCFRLGTIMHEFLHALGFYHQQSAANRDDYVRIVEENIQSGTIGNFNKYTETDVDDFGQEYDYASVMHYGPYAFSANGEMTIVPYEKGAENIIGQRLSLSQADINKLNIMYRCPVNV